MEILLCSLIQYPRQRKQRKPNIIQPGVEYNGRHNGHVNTSTQRTRQGHFFARFGYLEHTLGSYYARWNGLSRTETSQSVHKLWSKVITLAQNAPARLNQMFVVWTQPSHSLVLHPSDKPQTFKIFKKKLKILKCGHPNRRSFELVLGHEDRPTVDGCEKNASLSYPSTVMPPNH